MPIDALEGLPKSMKVVEISKFGGPDVLTIAERELPIPNAGEVLIREARLGRVAKSAPVPADLI